MVKKARKKQKVVRNSTPVGITDEDYNLLVDRMVEVAKETHQKIDNQHTQLFGEVFDLLQILCKSMKEVRFMISKKASQSQEASPSDDRPTPGWRPAACGIRSGWSTC